MRTLRGIASILFIISLLSVITLGACHTLLAAVNTVNTWVEISTSVHFDSKLSISSASLSQNLNIQTGSFSFQSRVSSDTKGQHSVEIRHQDTIGKHQISNILELMNEELKISNYLRTGEMGISNHTRFDREGLALEEVGLEYKIAHYTIGAITSLGKKGFLKQKVSLSSTIADAVFTISTSFDKEGLQDSELIADTKIKETSVKLTLRLSREEPFVAEVLFETHEHTIIYGDLCLSPTKLSIKSNLERNPFLLSLKTGVSTVCSIDLGFLFQKFSFLQLEWEVSSGATGESLNQSVTIGAYTYIPFIPFYLLTGYLTFSQEGFDSGAIAIVVPFIPLPYTTLPVGEIEASFSRNGFSGGTISFSTRFYL